jgi:hypothetical protein
MKIATLVKISGPPVLIASLCCLTPVVLVLLGASVGSFGVVLFTKTLGPYEWVFTGLGVIALAASLVVHFRSRGICTLDQAKARRNELINGTLLALIASAIGYSVWYFGVVGFAGKALRLWG